MTVEQLTEKLAYMNPDAEVLIDIGGSLVHLDLIEETQDDAGTVVIVPFWNGPF